MALPGLNEIVASLMGALSLLRRDTAGLNNFNLTEEGFWRSFFAMVLVLPMAAFAAVTFRETGETSAVALASRTSANLILQWVSFTALMLIFTQSMGLGHNYMRFITVHNWSAVVATLCMMIPLVMHFLGLVSIEAAVVMLIFVFLAMLAYFWFIARVTLETSGLVAAGIVFIDFLLNATIERLFGLQ